MCFPEYRDLCDDEYFTQKDREKMQQLVYRIIVVSFVTLIVGGCYLIYT